MTSKRRLHVWEHHSLHPDKGKAFPIHVIYDDQEFDYWYRDESGALRIGFQYETQYTDKTSASVQRVDHTIIASNMYAKVWLEEYEEDDEPTQLFDQADKIDKDDESEVTQVLDPQEALQILKAKMQDDDPGFVPARSRFEHKMPVDQIPLPEEREDIDPEPGKTKLIMPLRREPVFDKATGLDLTHIAEQVHKPHIDSPLILALPIGADAEKIVESASPDSDQEEKDESLLGLKASDVA